MQQAKIRKSNDIQNGVGQQDQVMATQEYIRKAVEDPNEDEDFKGSAWLSTIEFVSSDGIPNARLGEIKKYCKNGKLNQVFYMDGGSSQKQTLIIDAARSSDSGRGSQLSGSAFSLERGAEGTSNGVHISTTNNQSLHIDNEQENSNPVASVGPQCSMTSKEDTNQKIVTDEEMLIEADVIQSHAIVAGVTEGIKNGPTVSASLPLWTDEQLNELGDFEDDL